MKYISVRKATRKDIDRLITLQKQMAAYHHALDAIWGKGESDAVWKKIVLGLLRRGKDFSFLVLLCDGRVVGYATADIKEASPAYSVKRLGHVGSVFVEKRYRKFGLATLAIDHFMEWFKKNKITEVTLQVDTANSLGTATWKKLGFEDWRMVLRKKI